MLSQVDEDFSDMEFFMEIVLKIKNLIQRITIEQWLIIDAEYVKSDKKTDFRCIGSLIFALVMIVVQRYYGQSRNFPNALEVFVANFPFPLIWSRLYLTFACLILFFVIPYIFIRIVFHEKLRDHGFTLKGISRYMPIYLAMILVVIPLVVIVSFSKSFSGHYPLYQQAGDSWGNLLIWELSYGIYFIVLEFFFRGFMIFSLARYLGSFSIFVMTIPYVMVHFGKPFSETLGSIIAGIFLGTLALRTRSIFGGVFIHIIIAWSMDILALLQKGQLQNLF
jgi:uncharacterized protein